ncbi:MAG: hypothetical protein DSY80_09400 [Desulfocapsa sp.]|nr:MAG: hypothetical protein DSY80_09400 [Desulfocapsa sp.]
MFFGWSRRFTCSSRFSRVLVFFVILFSFALLLQFAGVTFFKKHLQQQEFSVAESALHDYLHQQEAQHNNSFSLTHPPVDLDFIRFVRGDEQVLMTGNRLFDFNKLVDLSPTITGTWVDLQDPSQSGEWTLVSLPLVDGGVAQGGKNVSRGGRAVYKLILGSFKWILLCSLLFSLSFSVLLVYIQESPLRELEKSLTNALKLKKLAPPGKENILTPLYRLLEKLFYQNQSLITEMQSSLDNVAHDLRTPMTRLRAIAEYALQSHSSDVETYRNALSDCLEESERVVAMLGVMMSVAEAEAGTMRLDLQPVNVFATLEDVTGLYQYVAEEAGIVINCNGAADCVVVADKTRISQVWANLLDNAIKYGRESGSVDIEAEQQGSELCVSFSDDGMGISASEIDRIWERLYRGDRSRSKQGLGLGLNYVKAVVEAHHGRVRVSSTIHKGSRFEVYLPLQTEITD